MVVVYYIWTHNPNKGQVALTQTSTHTHTPWKEVQLEHPTPINQLSKQIPVRPSIVTVLKNGHLGEQHKSLNCIPPPVCVHVCASVRVCVMTLTVMGRLCNHWWVDRENDGREGGKKQQQGLKKRWGRRCHHQSRKRKLEPVELTQRAKGLLESCDLAFFFFFFYKFPVPICGFWQSI